VAFLKFFAYQERQIWLISDMILFADETAFMSLKIPCLEYIHYPKR